MQPNVFSQLKLLYVNNKNDEKTSGQICTQTTFKCDTKEHVSWEAEEKLDKFLSTGRHK